MIEKLNEIKNLRRAQVLWLSNVIQILLVLIGLKVDMTVFVMLVSEAKEILATILMNVRKVQIVLSIHVAQIP